MISLNSVGESARDNWATSNQPTSANSSKEAEGQKPEADKKGDAAQTTIVNTDRVDAEIKGLKENISQLEQQLQRPANANDPDERKKLEAQLAQANAELSNKDTDAYRRANASVSAYA